MVTISVESGLARLKKKFRAEVGPGKQYWRSRPMVLTDKPTSPSTPLTAIDEISKHVGYAIYLSPEDFEHLCVLLSMDETDSMTRQYNEYFEAVTYEARLRQDNPAVQAAWEAYQVMLHLARPNND